MIKTPNRILKSALLLASVLLLAACGSNSSSTPAAATATVYYAHNFVFRNITSGPFGVGYNAFGQLGTGTTANSSIPFHIKHRMHFSGIAAGGDHSVAFFNNSTVFSWGYNVSGQLGDGKLANRSVPVKTGINFSNVIAVAAGGLHSLALKSDDTLWAWGANGFKQLGVHTVDAPGGHSKLPVRVGSSTALFSNISSIAAGGTFSLARANGSVWSWGDNSKGQAGQRQPGLQPPLTFTTYSSPNRVDDFQAFGGVAGIAAGGASSYAVARDGSVWAWGNNENGQLGNNLTTKSAKPVQVMKADGNPLTNVIQVAAGIQHALARDINNNVWAWGYNAFGQLGNNTNLDSHVAVPVLISGVITDIRAFGSSSMAFKDGHWYVWGDNTYGQLGTGSTGSILLPIRMPGF